MASSRVDENEDKGVAEVISDLWDLVREYAKQETIDPLKSIGRFLAWGAAGAIALSLALLFASLAILRGLQTETGAHLTGNWNWVPYLVTFVLDAVAIGVAILLIKKPARNPGSTS